MSKVAIIGDSTSVVGFRPLGFAVFAVRRPQDARELWSEVSGGEYGVVFVTEPVYEALGDLIAQSADSPVPAVTVIPGAGNPGGVGEAKLTRAIERALGTTVLTREEGQ
ncbi:MAG: V-type ATP synthase subunit F [Coriobacteriales bacterium]|nr:V-type ATP synthase subunit F [Actinomycetes bacterium]